MTRPAWEQVFTRSLAEHLTSTFEDLTSGFTNFMPKQGDYNAAALLVRALDRDLNLGIAAGNAASTEDFSNRVGDKLTSFWNLIGQTADVQDWDQTRAALWLSARSAYRTLPAEEIQVAMNIAKTAPLFGDADDDGWSGLRGARAYASLGCIDGPPGTRCLSSQEMAGLSGFGRVPAAGPNLRSEVIAAAPPANQASVAGAYDNLAKDASLLSKYVKMYQTWCQAHGIYNKGIDGKWGPGSEGAYINLMPEANNRYTNLEDVRTLTLAAGEGSVPLMASLAVGIKRDRWLASQGVDTNAPSNIPEVSVPTVDVDETDPTRVEITTPPAAEVPPRVQVIPVSEPDGEDEMTVENESAGEVPPRVNVTPVEDMAKAGLGWKIGLAVAGLLVLGAAVGGSK